MMSRNIVFQAVYTQRGTNLISISEDAESMDVVAENILSKNPAHVTPINEICVYMIELTEDEMKYLGFCRGLLISRMDTEADEDVDYGLKQFGIPKKIYTSLCEQANIFNARNLFSISDFGVPEEYADEGLGSFMLTMLPWVLENNTNLHIDMLCFHYSFIASIFNSAKISCVEHNTCFKWQAKYTDDLIDDILDRLNNNITIEQDENGDFVPPPLNKVYGEGLIAAKDCDALLWLSDIADLYIENTSFYYDSIKTVWEEDCVKMLHILKKNDYILADKHSFMFLKLLRNQQKSQEVGHFVATAGVTELENIRSKFNW